jgi:hypothetical protein
MVNVLKKHIEQVQARELDHMMMVLFEFVVTVVVVVDDDDDDDADLGKTIDDYMDLE